MSYNFQQMKIIERVAELEVATTQNITEDQKETLYNVDTDISTAIFMAEQKIPTYETPWWSEELYQDHKVVKYWKRNVYYIRMNINTKEAELKEIEDAIGVCVVVSQGIKNRKLYRQLRPAIKNRGHIRNNSFRIG
eukprot:11214812-Ditylum_brightwellii.AAC.1